MSAIYVLCVNFTKLIGKWNKLSELGLGGVDERWEWGRVEGHSKGTTIKFHHYIYNGLPIFEFHFLTGGWGLELGLGA